MVMMMSKNENGHDHSSSSATASSLSQERPSIESKMMLSLIDENDDSILSSGDDGYDCNNSDNDNDTIEDIRTIVSVYSDGSDSIMPYCAMRPVSTTTVVDGRQFARMITTTPSSSRDSPTSVLEYNQPEPQYYDVDDDKEDDDDDDNDDDDDDNDDGNAIVEAQLQQQQQTHMQRALVTVHSTINNDEYNSNSNTTKQKKKKKKNKLSKFWKPRSVRKRNYIHDDDIDVPEGCHVEHIESLLHGTSMFCVEDIMSQLNAITQLWSGGSGHDYDQYATRERAVRSPRITVQVTATTWNGGTSESSMIESSSIFNNSLVASAGTSSPPIHATTTSKNGKCCFVGTVYKRDSTASKSNDTNNIIQRGTTVTSLQQRIQAPITQYVTIDMNSLIVLPNTFDPNEIVSVLSTYLPAFAVLHHGNHKHRALRFSPTVFQNQILLLNGNNKRKEIMAIIKLALLGGIQKIYCSIPINHPKVQVNSSNNVKADFIIDFDCDMNLLEYRKSKSSSRYIHYSNTNQQATNSMMMVYANLAMIPNAYVFDYEELRETNAMELGDMNLLEYRKSKSSRYIHYNSNNEQSMMMVYANLAMIPNAYVFDYEELRETNAMELEADLKFLFHLLSLRKIRPRIDRCIAGGDLRRNGGVGIFDYSGADGDVIVEPWR
eukprot:CAMPEP_0119570970 /NCGR_PEP_ID=MMETSP1352-20130426/43883_1 /TAXON_ID=265584 /ORGANISM="Stauroneis constricta, Strain CCMP1120" /LENGTH=660 /DNA_ID=CAMNT_0007620647 /DNA_START=26 /DNA_END=2008 /DNA_ORIENTATION=+